MPKNLFSDPIARHNLRLRINAEQREAVVREQVEAEEAARAEQRAARLARAKINFADFCQEYLPTAFKVPFAEYQLALTRLVSQRTLSRADERLFQSLIRPEDHGYIVPEQERFDGILDVEPRDHGKTTRNTQALPLWIALNFPGSFIVIVAASSGAAEEMMDAAKAILEEDDAIIDDYGQQRIQGRKWAANKIQLANGSAIAAVGARQSLRGIKDKFQRPTHIICDDLLKDEDVESPVMRKKLYNWFKRVILNLGKGALTIVANTIMHPEDLPSRLLKEIEDGTLEDWIGLRFGAITPAGESLWPARWPLSELEKKRKQLGGLWFTEWMNLPISDEERAFLEEWFQYYLPRDIDLRDCDIVMGVDPATGLTTGDWSAIAVIAKHRSTGIYYILFCGGWKESDLKFANRICQVYRIYKPRLIAFEDRAFQRIYKREVMREASRQGLRLPMEGFSGGNKELRIKSLAPLIENGLLLFQEKGQELLIQQLLNFPRDHDDCPDAVEMAICKLEIKFVGGAPVKSQQVTKAVRQLSQFVRRFGKMR